LKDAGAVLIFGSDSPGTNAARYFLNPVYGLYAAVSRQTLTGEPKAGWFPDQRLRIEAIEAYTKGPAWASFEEDLKGSLAAGKLADIAVFDTDLTAVGRTDPSGCSRRASSTPSRVAASCISVSRRAYSSFCAVSACCAHASECGSVFNLAPFCTPRPALSAL
jgi:hypothetical protein